MPSHCTYCSSPEGHINQVVEGVSLKPVTVCQKDECNSKWISACKTAYHRAIGVKKCDECGWSEDNA
jgi:hypothetical protein